MAGKYDKITGDLVDVIWAFIKYTRKEYLKSGQEIFATRFLDIKDEKTRLKFKLQILIDRTNKEHSIINADAGKDDIRILVVLKADDEPLVYGKINPRLQETIRHEIEHILQKKKDPNSKFVFYNDFKYLVDDNEIPAMVRGLYRRSKISKSNIDDEIIDYLNYFLEEKYINKEEFDIVIQKWLEYTKENLPKAKFK